MRILVLSKKGINNAQTGDGTQTRNTIAALRKKGHQVCQFFGELGPQIFNEDEEPITLGVFEKFCGQFDVIHLLPVSHLLCKQIEHILEKFPVVMSSIYWNDITRVIMAVKNSQGINKKIRGLLGVVKSGRKSVMDFKRSVDVVLPNSFAESQNVRKNFLLSSHACVVPVPNAISTVNFGEKGLVRPEVVPLEDYIVCPGVFATRKNQLGLIRALKKSKIPIVFMGGVNEGALSYYRRCIAEANDNMIFLGHISNESELYWGVLRHARCACLASDCETPGIAMLEAACLGARPVITRYGGTVEYYGLCAEYFDPLNSKKIRSAVESAWARGPLCDHEIDFFSKFTWDYCATMTIHGYEMAKKIHKDKKSL